MHNHRIFNLYVGTSTLGSSLVEMTNATELAMTCNIQQSVSFQGVYKFNRTNFQEVPGGISRKIQDMFVLLCNIGLPNILHLMEHVMMSSKQCSSLCYSTDYNISYIFNIASYTTWGHSKDKIRRPVS